MKDIKYFAGLIDADGSFTFNVRKLTDGNFRIRARCAIYQKNQFDLLQEFGSQFEVNPYTIKRDNLDCVVFVGKKALRLIEHLRSHLVIKRPVADFVVKHNNKIVSESELKNLKAQLKTLRLVDQPERNFPSRKWMAGYIDGDGCLISSKNKRGYLCFNLTVTSHGSQKAGLDLMHKCFGGSIYCDKNSEVYRWKLPIGQSTLGKLEYFGKHLKIKHEQYRLIHDVLKNNRHGFRNGATPESNKIIHQQLQSMKGTRND